MEGLPLSGSPSHYVSQKARRRLLIEDLQVYTREQVGKLSRGHDLAEAFNYILKRWGALPCSLRKSRLFCGSDRGGRHVATMYSLIVTAKIKRVDPQAWLRCPRPHRGPSGSSIGRTAVLEVNVSELFAQAA
jgi:hypothetical protein